MFKWRDFYLMKVYDSKNKYIGVVEDVSIDFNKGIIEGFTISPASIIKKHTFVSSDAIVSIDKVMRIKETSKFKGLKFKEIKFIDIINANNKLIGVLEDLIIDKEEFSIKGAKYNLDKYTLEIGDSRTVSNEFITDEIRLELSNGTILVVYSKD